MCLLLDRGAHFCKNTKILQNLITFLQKIVCIATKRREQKAPAIKKLQDCKCDKCCRFADRALEAQNTQVASENQNYDGWLKWKGDEPNGQKSDKCPKDGPMSPYLRPSMPQKVDVWRRIAQSCLSKMCLPLERGAHSCKITEKIQTKTTYLQKNVCVAIKSGQQKALTIKKLQNCKCDKWCRLQDDSLCRG